MQKAILLKPAGKIISMLLWAAGFYLLSTAGIGALWAAVGAVLLKAAVRFIFRITVMLVSVAVLIAIFILFIAVCL
jgi:hypothetical protein